MMTKEQQDAPAFPAPPQGEREAFEGLSAKLWCDLRTDEERSAWLLLGRGHETGVVAQALQNDLAMAYHRLALLSASLRASPAVPVAQDERELPPLPEAELTCWYGPSSEFHEEPMFSADQMRDYARAALSASTQPADKTWTAHEDCGMRHPEACDLMGGETDASIPPADKENGNGG